MVNPIKVIDLSNGISFGAINSDRFKTNRISISFVMPIKRETVTVNALISQLLKRGYKGCDSFTMLNRELQELYGAYVSGSVIKRGDAQIVSLSITGVDDKFALEETKISKKLSEILINLAFNQALTSGGFIKENFELEKNALGDLIKSEINDKMIYVLNQTTKIMCKDEPCGLPKYGFVEDLKDITAEIAFKQYQEMIETSQIVVMFTGCGDDTDAVMAVRKATDNLKRSFKVIPPTAPHKFDGKVKEIEENLSVNQSKLVLGFETGIGSNSPLLPAMKMARGVLGGSPTSKLFSNVREKLSLCYYCAARYDVPKGIMLVDSGVEFENIGKAKAEIINQINDIKASNFTDKEINDALMTYKNSYNSIYESDSSLEGFYLAKILDGVVESPEDEIRKLENVSREDILKAADMIKLDTVYSLSKQED